MNTLAEQIAAAFRAACLDELEAPKPGNVHVFAVGHRMTVGGFRPERARWPRRRLPAPGRASATAFATPSKRR